MNEFDLYRSIGRNVRVAREASDMTQEDVASAAGVLRTSIANIEAGRQRVPLHTLSRIADALQTPVSALLPREIAPDSKLSAAYQRIAELEERLARVAKIATR